MPVYVPGKLTPPQWDRWDVWPRRGASHLDGRLQVDEPPAVPENDGLRRENKMLNRELQTAHRVIQRRRRSRSD